MGTFETGGNGDNGNERRPNIIRLHAEGGYEEVANDLITELQSIIAGDPTLHVTNEDVETRKQLFLAEKTDRAQKIEAALEASIRALESGELSGDRALIVYYWGAALAYEELTPEEKADADHRTPER